MKTTLVGLLAALIAGEPRSQQMATLPPMPPNCGGDLTADRVVDDRDLGVLLEQSGPCTGCASDLNADGVVNGRDLGLVLGGWAECPVTTPPWATPMEAAPNPSVATDPVLREQIASTGMRLSTEAEREYAYRAATTTAFHGSSAHPTGTNDDSHVGSIAWFEENSNDRTHPVGGKFGDGFGLHDMSGTVAERVNDRFSGSY